MTVKIALELSRGKNKKNKMFRKKSKTFKLKTDWHLKAKQLKIDLA